ncbi:MAG TPA: FtsX-like permease family protein, partial [Vicinamibacterales bacterium]|nr:FtsX-like permease family protein [Vicinamibacterales bacterium]
APDVVGREVRINGIPRTIVGVLPRGFVGPMGAVDFFFAFDLQLARASGAGWLRLIGRLKPGVTHDAARRDVAAAWASRDDPRQFSGVAMSSIPLRDALVGPARAPLLILMASAALVLVVACANLAGALLSRGLARRKELAVRAALGAGRRRLIRQLLVESTLLAVIGGAAGVLVGAVMLSLMRGLAAPVLPAYAALSLDAPALVVMALLALAAGVACGIAPALSIHHRDPHGTLSSGSRGATDAPRPRRLRGLMVAGQLALCAMLLAGASLLTRSLWRLTTAPLGFEPDGVLAVTVRLLPRDYPTLAARSRFHQQIAEGIRRIPGVDAVAVANKPPAVDPRHDPFTFDGAPPDTPIVHVVFATVSDDYFRVMRVPVLQGRTFDRSDGEASTPTAVISDTLARRYWPDGRAVGARIRLGGDPVTVIGIVGDVRNELARLDPEPMAYRSFRQSSTGGLAILVATRQDPMSLVRPVQRELSALNASMVIQRATPLASAVDDGLAARKLPMLLMSAFAVLALLLAAIGVYAMFANMASAREREFGVRVALGSRPRAIAALLLRQGAVWMLTGISAGAIGTALGVQWLRRVFADVPAFDPLALGGALAVLVAAATVALLIPVHRATRADPIAALRAE